MRLGWIHIGSFDMDNNQLAITQNILANLMYALISMILHYSTHIYSVCVLTTEKHSEM